MQLRIWIITILLAAGLAACVPVVTPTPLPTPETELAEPVPVTVERPLPPPTPTNTPLPTKTAVPTQTATPIPPIITSTSIPIDTPPIIETATTLPELVWTVSSDVLARIAGDSLVWSPVSNEFILNACPDDRFPQTPHYIFLATAPDFVLEDISSSEITCRQASFMWRPDGQQFIFEGLPAPEDDLFESELWMLDRNGQNLQHLGRRGRHIDFAGWMDNDTFVYRDHWGQYNWLVYIFDIDSDVVLASAYIHGADIHSLNQNFVISNDSLQIGGNTAAAISPEINSTDNSSGNNIKFLSPTERSVYLFNSSVADTILNQNQVLVTTWDANEQITDTLHTRRDLQLWDLQTDELTMLVPKGYSGQMTPDGQYLAAITPASEFPQLQLSNQWIGDVIFSRPAYDWGLSFSPNGRYFTFFTPEPDLSIYDLKTGEMLPPLTAVPAIPLWSPNSTRFVYTDSAQGLAIYDIRTHTAYPLAETGGERLSDPQWSFDGAYLSVAYRTEDHEWQTAVLALP